MFDSRRGETRFSNDPNTNSSALPIAFGLAALFHAVGVGEIPRIIAGGTFHEMGHAGVAILGGRWAFFVPFAFTLTTEDRSMFVFTVVVGLSAWLGRQSWREGHRVTTIICALVAMTQVTLSFVVSQDTWRMWMVFFGCGGELVLGAAAVCAFYHRFPDRLRWDFWRYPALFVSAPAFFESALFWIRMDPGLAATLGGDTVENSRESDQDMVRLVRTWGWTAPQLISAYRLIALACVLTIAIHYAWYWVAALKAPREQTPAA